MKKISNKGFVLAETLVVTVFLMVIFSMIYANYYPLIGEYEKKETYDDIDSKYGIFWIKRFLEDESYDMKETSSSRATIKQAKLNTFKNKGYFRFECSDIVDDQKRITCASLVKSLEVARCNERGDECDIFVTKYRLDKGNKNQHPSFKETLENFSDLKYQNEDCTGTDCETIFVKRCQGIYNGNEGNESQAAKCRLKGEKKAFTSGIQDYVFSLPDYKLYNSNYDAPYRIIVAFEHEKDDNDYYSYGTIEVMK